MMSALSAGAERQQTAHGVLWSLQVADGAPSCNQPPLSSAMQLFRCRKETKWFLQSTSSVLATRAFQQGLYKQAQQIYVLEDVSR